jgi:hypothetical protein
MFPGRTQDKQRRLSRPSYATPPLNATNLPPEKATIAPFPTRAASETGGFDRGSAFTLAMGKRLSTLKSISG